MTTKRTIIVSGMIAADPWQGGATWAVLQYILGLRRLGHDVFFIEPIPSKALRPADGPLADSENAAYFRSVTTEFGLRERAALLLAGKRETFGLTYEQLQQAAQRADALINISGMLADETLTAKIPVRVYLDIDPAFNQLWHAVQQVDMRFAGHTHHVTIGQNIGAADCSVPTCGLRWLKTFQPVVLEHWPAATVREHGGPVARRITHDGLTTIANWRGYGSIDFNGVTYGQKVHSLRPFISLPTLTNEKFQLALAIHPGETRDLAKLRANRWELLDPARVANTPARYREFIQGSKAEFGIAKSGYVHSHCGWFSDRSICYLASGRPVIAQETGFSRGLPTGEGLLAFNTAAEVLRAIDLVNEDYARHAMRARALAEELFDSDKVLRRLLAQVGI